MEPSSSSLSSVTFFLVSSSSTSVFDSKIMLAADEHLYGADLDLFNKNAFLGSDSGINLSSQAPITPFSLHSLPVTVATKIRKKTLLLSELESHRLLHPTKSTLPCQSSSDVSISLTPPVITSSSGVHIPLSEPFIEIDDVDEFTPEFIHRNRSIFRQLKAQQDHERCLQEVQTKLRFTPGSRSGGPLVNMGSTPPTTNGGYRGLTSCPDGTPNTQLDGLRFGKSHGHTG
ncbi:hypothetical protein L1987_06041 [Smallanthus sonchifolius]|uniref:Uncharacterized protein n=1 Tax=Smallanthus sonchifolius TaxID=185202 RepID=A0ACB9JX22_9ASTR|nr:hypothetical protein L1987_06041 [Smallanthus sonchifolius]